MALTASKKYMIINVSQEEHQSGFKMVSQDGAEPEAEI